MDIFNIRVFDYASPFNFISQHITLGYLCVFALIYIFFVSIWKKISHNAGLIPAIFPFTPLFSYFFYASANITIILLLGRYNLGILWLVCILLIYVITLILLSFIKSLSQSKSLVPFGVTLYRVSQSKVCLIIFFISFLFSIYLSYSGGIGEINNPDRILLSYSGGIRKYITQLIFSPYLFLYTGSILLNSTRITVKNFVIFGIYISYITTISFFAGSKGFILGFVFLYWLIIYKFNLINKIFYSFKRGRINYVLIPLIIIIFVVIFVFINSRLYTLFFYLIEYIFVSPIECTTVVIKESIDTTKAIGANYFLILLEPLHKLHIGIQQYKPGNAINLASSYLPDSQYGGTNPSVFCQSTSEHYSATLIPFFWCIFSSWFLAFSSFLFDFFKKNHNNYSTHNQYQPQIVYPLFILPEKRHYSKLATAFFALLVYSQETPQRSWVEWILNVIYQFVGTYVWMVLLRLLTANRK